MASVLYICNGKNPKCKTSSFCQIECQYTHYSAYAKYGECKDPEKDPDRFEKFAYGEGCNYFVERPLSLRKEK